MAGLELKVWELICYCFIFVMGLIGNLATCLVVLKSGPEFRRVPFNVYLMSLAIVDLTLAVVCLPIYVMSTATFPHPTGTKGDILCKTITGYLIPFWLEGTSIYLLVIISFERYTAVSKPFLAMTRRTSKKTVLYVAGAWLIGLAIELPTIIGIRFASTSPTVGNYCAYMWKSATLSRSIYACTFAFQYVFPAVIFIVNFYRIQKCLARLDGDLDRSFTDPQQRFIVMRKKKRTVHIVFIVTIAFFICCTPDNVMYFLFQYGGMAYISWNSNVYQAGVILGFFNSCINPFLYAFQSKDFRSHCKKILKKMFAAKPIRRQPCSYQTTLTTNGSSSSASPGRKNVALLL